MPKPNINQKLLRELLDYNPETGALSWKARPREMFKTLRGFRIWEGRFAGTPAFNAPHNAGYKHGRLGGVNYLAHRIIWAWVYGEWPLDVDHINHDRADNRISNLRSVSRRENLQNRKAKGSGAFGVTKGASGRWTASISAHGKRTAQKTFDSYEEAVAYRKQLEIAAGYHHNHGGE